VIYKIKCCLKFMLVKILLYPNLCAYFPLYIFLLVHTFCTHFLHFFVRFFLYRLSLYVLYTFLCARFFQHIFLYTLFAQNLCAHLFVHAFRYTLFIHIFWVDFYVHNFMVHSISIHAFLYTIFWTPFFTLFSRCFFPHFF